MKIEPTGHYVVVKTDEVEETYGESKIVVVKDEDRERAAQIFGYVVAVGPRAFEDFLDREVITQPDGSVVVLNKPGKPWVTTGDRVAYSRYAGKPIDPDDPHILILRDEDIVAKVSDE